MKFDYNSGIIYQDYITKEKLKLNDTAKDLVMEDLGLTHTLKNHDSTVPLSDAANRLNKDSSNPHHTKLDSDKPLPNWVKTDKLGKPFPNKDGLNHIIELPVTKARVIFRENEEINTIYPIACKPHMKNRIVEYECKS